MKLRRFVALLPATGGLGLALLLHPAAGRDDAYLTWWSAMQLAAGVGIVNYNGEAVEQSSSLLWVLLLAGLRGLFPVDLALLGRLASLASAFAAVLLGGRLARSSALAAGLLLASAPAWSYWSASGMETSLVGLLLLAYGVGLTRWLQGASSAHLLLPLLALLLVRPEAPFLAFATAGGVFVLFGPTHRARASSAMGWIAGLSLGIAAARWAVFGSLLPQPALAKAGLGVDRVGLGLRYLTLEHAWWLPLALLALASRPWRAQQPLQLRVLGLLACAGLGFVVVAGGDSMELGRFVAPVLPILAVLGSDALLRHRRHRLVLGAVLGVHLLGLVAAGGNSAPAWALGEPAAHLDPERHHLLERSNRIQRRDIGSLEYLRALLGGRDDEPVLFTHQGGFVPFHLAAPGRLRVLEPNGLHDPTLMGCPEARQRYVGTRFGRSRRGVGVVHLVPELLEEVLPACGLHAPEVVYALGSPPTSALDRLGYRLVLDGSASWVAVLDAWLPGSSALEPCPEFDGRCSRESLPEGGEPGASSAREPAVEPTAGRTSGGNH